MGQCKLQAGTKNSIIPPANLADIGQEKLRQSWDFYQVSRLFILLKQKLPSPILLPYNTISKSYPQDFARWGLTAALVIGCFSANSSNEIQSLKSHFVETLGSGLNPVVQRSLQAVMKHWREDKTFKKGTVQKDVFKKVLDAMKTSEMMKQSISTRPEETSLVCSRYHYSCTVCWCRTSSWRDTVSSKFPGSLRRAQHTSCDLKFSHQTLHPFLHRRAKLRASRADSPLEFTQSQPGRSTSLLFYCSVLLSIFQLSISHISSPSLFQWLKSMMFKPISLQTISLLNSALQMALRSFSTAVLHYFCKTSSHLSDHAPSLLSFHKFHVSTHLFSVSPFPTIELSMWHKAQEESSKNKAAQLTIPIWLHEGEQVPTTHQQLSQTCLLLLCSSRSIPWGKQPKSLFSLPCLQSRAK